MAANQWTVGWKNTRAKNVVNGGTRRELECSVQPDKKKRTTDSPRCVNWLNRTKAWTQDEIAQQSVTVQGLQVRWSGHFYDDIRHWSKGDKTSGCTFFTRSYRAKLGNEICFNCCCKTHSKLTRFLDEMRWESGIHRTTDKPAWLRHAEKLSRPMAKIGHPRPLFPESPWRCWPRW